MNPIKRRCCWCKPKHLMTPQGEYIPGNAHEPGQIYSDGLCKKAEIIVNKEIDKMEKK